MGTLADALALFGETPSSAAVKAGLDPAFLLQVDLGVQPLPYDVADLLVSLAGNASLKMKRSELIGRVGYATKATGTVARTALPPPSVPTLGQNSPSFPALIIAPTKPVPY